MGGTEDLGVLGCRGFIRERELHKPVISVCGCLSSQTVLI